MRSRSTAHVEDGCPSAEPTVCRLPWSLADLLGSLALMVNALTLDRHRRVDGSNAAA